MSDDSNFIAGDSNSAAVKAGIDSQQCFEMEHVTTRFGRTRLPAYEDRFLSKLKRTRNVAVVAPSFMSVPGYVIGTRRIATMHRKLDDRLVQYLPLSTCAVPFDIPPIRETVQWHVTAKNDHAIQWVLEELRTFTRESLGQVHPAASEQLGDRMIAFEANAEESLPA